MRAMRKAGVDRISGTGRVRSVIVGKYCRLDESGKTFPRLSFDRFPDRVRPAGETDLRSLGRSRGRRNFHDARRERVTRGDAIGSLTNRFANDPADETYIVRSESSKLLT